MSEYKELVEILRSYSTEVVSYKIDGAFAYAATAAADAIEQLEADNESYKCAFADLHNEIANYCETIATLEKERDAAVADLYELFTKDESPCAFCVAEHCDKCIKPDRIDYPYWEWRGVQDEVSE